MPFFIPTATMTADEAQQFADLNVMIRQETARIHAEMAANPNDPRHFLARLMRDADRQARQNAMEAPAPPMMTPEQLWNGAVRDDWTTANPHNPTLDWDLPGGVNFPIDVDLADNNPPPRTRNQIRRDRYKERRRAERAQDQRARHEGTRPPSGRANSPIDVDAPSPRPSERRLLTPPFDPRRIHEAAVSSLLLDEFNSSVDKMHNDQDARGVYHDLAMKAITTLRAVETDLHYAQEACTKLKTWKDAVLNLAECMICLEPIRELRAFSCGHAVCKTCADTMPWEDRSRRKKCPLCRRVSLTYPSCAHRELVVKINEMVFEDEEVLQHRGLEGGNVVLT